MWLYIRTNCNRFMIGESISEKKDNLIIIMPTLRLHGFKL